MPNKKTKTTKSIPPKKRRNRIVILIFSVIAGLALMYAVGIAVISAIRLESAGSKLNQMRAEVLKSGIDVALYRDKYCWRTQEKFSNGSRSCHQRLVIVGQGRVVPEQKIESKRIVEIVEKVINKKVYSEEFISYSDTGVATASDLISKKAQNIANCVLHYSAYDDSRPNDNLANNIYAFDIRCTEYMPTLGLYPYRGHGFPSWETYVDPT